MGRSRRVNPSQPTSPTLPWLIGLLAVSFTGLIVNDHVLPALRPEQAASAAAAGAARVTGSPGPGVVLRPGLARGGARREWPLLTGVAAERAMRERQREAALGKLQHPPDPYLLPPAL